MPCSYSRSNSEYRYLDREKVGSVDHKAKPENSGSVGIRFITHRGTTGRPAIRSWSNGLSKRGHQHVLWRPRSMTNESLEALMITFTLLTMTRALGILP